MYNISNTTFGRTSKENVVYMAEHHIYKRPKNGGPIEVTARQLAELYEKHEGILASRQYKDLKEMVLID